MDLLIGTFCYQCFELQFVDNQTVNISTNRCHVSDGNMEDEEEMCGVMPKQVTADLDFDALLRQATKKLKNKQRKLWCCRYTENAEQYKKSLRLKRIQFPLSCDNRCRVWTLLLIEMRTLVFVVVVVASYFDILEIEHGNSLFVVCHLAGRQRRWLRRKLWCRYYGFARCNIMETENISITVIVFFWDLLPNGGETGIALEVGQ